MKKYTILLLAVFIGFQLKAQQLFEGARIANGRFELMVDLRLGSNEQKEFAMQYDLDSLLAKRLFEKDFRFINDSSPWQAILLSEEKVLLSKSLSESSGEIPDLSQFILSEFMQPNNFIPSDRQAVYGINDLLDEAAFVQMEDECCFFLRGHKSANKIMLAGTFNNWNTMQTAMQRVDSGWISCLKLKAGKYSYKYIIDGRWTTDPANKQKENNEHGTKNSVVFVYNYQFRLEGFRQADNVSLAGSFNNWNPNELKMQQTTQGWLLPLYLREGTYTYKFVVDNNWILDPANAATRPDGKGNTNSVLSLGQEIHFSLPGYLDAEKVVLSGSFNNWNRDEIVLSKTNNGWQTSYAMAPGLYEYKYIIDGQWLHDPANPYTTGEPPYLNSLIAVEPNHVFSLNGYTEASEVLVTGSFNGWRKDGYRMQRKKNGWIFPIHLPPGRYTYKFVIDGQWILDPDNPFYEKNEYDTDNSVLWIEQE
jgi:hypothetical protein